MITDEYGIKEPIKIQLTGVPILPSPQKKIKNEDIGWPKWTLTDEIWIRVGYEIA